MKRIPVLYAGFIIAAIWASGLHSADVDFKRKIFIYNLNTRMQTLDSIAKAGNFSTEQRKSQEAQAETDSMLGKYIYAAIYYAQAIPDVIGTLTRLEPSIGTTESIIKVAPVNVKTRGANYSDYTFSQETVGIFYEPPKKIFYKPVLIISYDQAHLKPILQPAEYKKLTTKIIKNKPAGDLIAAEFIFRQGEIYTGEEWDSISLEDKDDKLLQEDINGMRTAILVQQANLKKEAWDKYYGKKELKPKIKKSTPKKSSSIITGQEEGVKARVNVEKTVEYTPKQSFNICQIKIQKINKKIQHLNRALGIEYLSYKKNPKPISKKAIDKLEASLKKTKQEKIELVKQVKYWQGIVNKQEANRKIKK